MSADPKVELILLWHQHQPDYRDPRTGQARLPWVRLHGSKDYLDMVERLERFPRVKATFNFVPSLLDQIEAAIAGGGDDLFDLLVAAPADLSAEERERVARRCAHVPLHARARWPELAARLSALPSRGEVDPETLLWLEAWFLLAWLDPTFLAEPEAVAATAAATAGRFTLEHRDGLLALHRRILGRIVPAHRALADRGQIELSTSPYYHPILPLIVDVRALARARPDLPLPREPFAAPEDARRQLERAIERHARAFGHPPQGAWPSEGSVSPEVVELAASLGLSWVATDEAVLLRSLDGGERPPAAVHQPWRLDTAAGSVVLFFRDRDLSDRIGFVYQRWDPKAAAEDFLERVRRIGRDHPPGSIPVVSVMLDGENCWEGYHDDGGPFLDQLYGGLDHASDIVTTTPAAVVARSRELRKLSRLHSGSWIDADFHIWAGHPEKNRAWDLLSRARATLSSQGETKPEAWEALMRAEGSDWFWWLGDDHFTSDKSVFDLLFRSHLRAIYEACGVSAPLVLEVPVAMPPAVAASTESPVGYVEPRLDGRHTHFYEWTAAGHRRVAGKGGVMRAGSHWVSDLYYGFGRERFFLRVDFATPPGEGRALRVEILEPISCRFEVTDLGPGDKRVERVGEDGGRGEVPGAICRMEELLELALPRAALAAQPGDPVLLMVQVLEGGRPVESAPPGDAVRLVTPDESFDASVWRL